MQAAEAKNGTHSQPRDEFPRCEFGLEDRVMGEMKVPEHTELARKMSESEKQGA